ncbi:hypothetical protein [Elioraea sp.]|uniref:hypothetical protein n=1 Tax=Elioraea sp. TaxID=2185103 RepID=UPI0025BA721D|nr:hypothetical protein [Elioraea sp.]
MRMAKTRHHGSSQAARSIAVDDPRAWAAHERAAATQDTERLAWPMAIVVIVSLSTGLWLAIGLLARIAVG